MLRRLYGETNRKKMDAIREFNTVIFYLRPGLSDFESGNHTPDAYKGTAYNTHIKKPCHQVREAASYILALSIIPLS
jgi:hypothetical protein